jgi:hypothetical protein
MWTGNRALLDHLHCIVELRATTCRHPIIIYNNHTAKKNKKRKREGGREGGRKRKKKRGEDSKGT